MSLLADTDKLKNGVLRYYRPGTSFKFVVGAQIAEKLLDELAVMDRQYQVKPKRREGELKLTALHGYPVEIDGPADEIRFMAVIEYDEDD